MQKELFQRQNMGNNALRHMPSCLFLVCFNDRCCEHHLFQTDTHVQTSFALDGSATKPRNPQLKTGWTRRSLCLRGHDGHVHAMAHTAFAVTAALMDPPPPSSLQDFIHFPCRTETANTFVKSRALSHASTALLMCEVRMVRSCRKHDSVTTHTRPEPRHVIVTYRPCDRTATLLIIGKMEKKRSFVTD